MWPFSLHCPASVKGPKTWGCDLSFDSTYTGKERVVRGDYLDPDGGAAAFEELFSLGHQDGLVTGPRGATLRVSGMALSCSCFQSQIHGLVAVQTVHGVVKSPAILGPWGHPLGTAVLVGVLCRFCATLGRH